MAKLSSKSFTAVDTFSTPIFLREGQSYYYSVSGTFVATIRLEKSEDGGKSWKMIQDFTAASSGNLVSESKDRQDYLYRLNCIAYTSGTAVTVLNGANLGVRQIHNCGIVAKAGTTSGWVVGAADNVCLSTCPASKTASTLVVPIRGLKLGDKINGFHLIGQIESGGNTVTVDCNLRKQLAAAADVVDSSVASIAQLSVAAQAVMSSINTSSPDFPCVVGDGESYYFLIAATTGSSCDIALQGIAVFVE
jgi:hypothetical protein